jgi:hypothetical protein
MRVFAAFRFVPSETCTPRRDVALIPRFDRIARDGQAVRPMAKVWRLIWD